MTPDTGGSPGGIDRRDVLKAAGAGAAGVAAFSGVGSAHPPEEVRFCGCSRVCVDSNNSYRVIYMVEHEWQTTCSLEPTTSDPAESEPQCIEADENETILGVLGGGRNIYWNPNACAEKGLDWFSIADCDGCDDGLCNNRVTYLSAGPDRYEVEGESVTVRTGNCDPPSEWERDVELPNGFITPF